MKETKTIISVIIPAKNRHEFVEQAIASVMSQKLPNYLKTEIIVVDNRSNPSQESVLYKKFPNVKYVKNNGFDSPGGSRNIGLKYINGSYVAFLDSDDKWKKEFILNSFELIRESNMPATVCLTDPFFHGSFPLLIKMKIYILNLIKLCSLLFCWLFYKGRLPKPAFFLCQISHMLFNRDFIKNKFDEKTVAAEDWEFVADVSSKKNIIILPRKLVDFRYELRSNTFNPKVKKGKEKAYFNLIKKLDKSHKTGIFHVLFKLYIKVFLLK